MSGKSEVSRYQYVRVSRRLPCHRKLVRGAATRRRLLYPQQQCWSDLRRARRAIIVVLRCNSVDDQGDITCSMIDQSQSSRFAEGARPTREQPVGAGQGPYSILRWVHTLRRLIYWYPATGLVLGGQTRCLFGRAENRCQDQSQHQTDRQQADPSELSFVGVLGDDDSDSTLADNGCSHLCWIATREAADLPTSARSCL